MALVLSSPKSQPFGLLSSNARTPFKIDDKTWNSVNEYAYLNLFPPKGDYRNKMKNNLFFEPYNFAAAQREKYTEKLFSDAVVGAMRTRFSQNETVKQKLVDTVGTELVMMTPVDASVFAFYSAVRSEPGYFYDVKYGQVPKGELGRVIEGVKSELLKNPKLKYEPYSELKRYEVPHDVTYVDVPGLYNLDHLILVLRRDVGKIAYDESVKRFKAHALDEYLNYILKTYYPKLSPSEYETAKSQQMAGADVDAYADQIYTLYENKRLNADVAAALTFAPDDYALKTAEWDLRRTLSEASSNPKTRVRYEDEIMPHNGPVTIDGKNYASCVHYAYSVLLKDIKADAYDANDYYDLNALSNEYKRLSNEWLVSTLTRNVELATDAKFGSDPSLSELLLRTGNAKLRWADATDPILGGEENRAGIYLEYYRDNKARRSDRSMRSFPNPSDTTAFKFWLNYVAADFANAMNLLTDPDDDELALIYGTQAHANAPAPSRSDAAIMTDAGLDDAGIALTWPFAYARYAAFAASKPDAHVSETDAVASLVRTCAAPRVTDATRKAARKYLKSVYKMIRSDASDKKFVDTILACRSGGKEIPSRINYWASLIVPNYLKYF